MKIIYTLLVGCMFFATATAQTSLRGKVFEKESGEPLLFANVALKKNGVFITGTQTDFDGIYTLSNIDPGTYTLEASYVGFSNAVIEGVVVKADTINRLDIEMSSDGVALDEVTVIAYKVPIIEKDNTTTGGTITSEQIRKLPRKSRDAIAGTTAGARSEIGRKQKKQAKKNKDPKDQVVTQPNTEAFRKIVENEYIDPSNEPLSTFSIDVDNASYSNVRRYINRNQKPPEDAIRIEEMINYFDYDYPQPANNEPFSVVTELSDCPWNEKHQLLHIGLQGENLDMEQAAPNNLVFLLDVSGSMRAANKLELVKPAFNLLVDQLRPQDRVAIVVYSGAAGLVLESTSGANKEKIREAIQRLQAGGSTAGGAGIQLAYKVAKEQFIEGGNNRVILATDGDFNVGVASEGGLERLIETKRKDNIFLTVLGFGMGNYKDNYLEILADKGNGNYAYIDNIREAKKMFQTELTGTLYTIAKDVKIQIEFNPQQVKSYRLVGYENRLLNKEDFNDDTKDAGELGAGHTVTALYEIVPAKAKKSLAKSVDPLRYQTVSVKQEPGYEKELCLVKLRYKEPKGKKSKLIQQSVNAASIPLANSSENFRFAAAVAGFGQLIRDSKYKGKWTTQEVIDLAGGAKGTDAYGYRSEFLLLVESMGLLAKR